MSEDTKAVFGEVRFSYEHVWEPASMDNDPNAKKKYSVSVIIPKSDKKSVEICKRAIKAAMQKGLESKFGGKDVSHRPNFKNPLRDGDTERDGDPAYANSYFINASDNRQPGIVDNNRQPITDRNEFYSGCYGYVSINFYPFNSNGNMGIAAGLSNVMKTRDGEAFDGRTTPDDDFADVDIPETPTGAVSGDDSDWL